MCSDDLDEADPASREPRSVLPPRRHTDDEVEACARAHPSTMQHQRLKLAKYGEYRPAPTLPFM